MKCLPVHGFFCQFPEQAVDEAEPMSTRRMKCSWNWGFSADQAVTSGSCGWRIYQVEVQSVPDFLVDPSQNTRNSSSRCLAGRSL
jgi:hypothetical protein